jgi:signal transduction histidine kinase
MNDGTPSDLHAQGRLLYRMGQFTRAIEVLSRALAADPSQGETWYIKGLAEFHSGRTEPAIESFCKAIERSPSNTIALYHLAVVHSRAGDLPAAIGCLERIAASGAEDSAAHYQLGLAHYALGDLPEAARQFARCIERDPMDAQARRMFAMVGGRLTEAPARRARRTAGAAGGRLRSTLVLRVALTAAIVFLLFGGGLAFVLVRAAEAEDMSVARDRAEFLADTVRRSLPAVDDAGGEGRLRAVVSSIGRERRVALVRVMAKHGLVRASNDASEIDTTMPPSEPACLRCHGAEAHPRGGWDEFREVPIAGGARGLELLRPLRPDASAGSAAPTGMLQMVTSLADVDARAQHRRDLAIAVMAIASTLVIAIVAAIVWFFVRRPLASLQAAVGRVAAGELEAEVPPERSDEIGDLAQSFNTMTRELRRSRHEVNEAQAGLERRVDEATARERQANAELREANGALTRFDQLKSAYMQKVVHDLRGPLNTIVMALGGVNSGVLGPLTEPQRDMLQRAERRAGAMTRLISDLLELERLRSVPARPARVPVSPMEILGKAMDAVRIRADEKRVTVETEGLHVLPDIVGDPSELDSVWVNLLDNAVKYTPQGGLVRVAGRVEGGFVIVDVTDTGIGIPAAEIPLLFAEFFRASNARVREREGTGLGLVIVRRIVEAHGGAIEVTSDEGKGTTVTVRLPIAPPALPASAPA